VKQRFDWPEVKKFYELRNSHLAKHDHDNDPDALQAVVAPGQPPWFNRYKARNQQRAYQVLFGLLPTPISGARALDIGCGTGRWSRFLSDRGYRTVGIELQPALIEAARRRHPRADFLCTSVQDYPPPEEPFELVSSVEVIQHNPFQEQYRVVGKIREFLRVGGYVIVLEGIQKDSRPYYFPRTIAGWVDVFEGSGFRTLAIQRYEYNLVMAAMSFLRTAIRGGHRSSRNDTFVEDLAEIRNPESGYLPNIAKRVAVGLDTIPESVLVHRNASLPSHQCGFLFQAI
jgi:2-polyprenyl-3-methyl-5-hydroxy-6-metoxy-1,4-benzoquinol methylase